MPLKSANNPHRQYLLSEISELIGAELKGDPRTKISGVGPLDQATAEQLSFAADPKYARHVAHSEAAAFIVPRSMANIERPLLISDHPMLALARAAQLFFDPPRLDAGVHETAIIGESVDMGLEARVGPLAQIGNGTSIGRRTRIYGGTYIGSDCTIGEECLIYPGVVILDRCVVGSRVVVHSGTVVGGDGFGFAQDEKGHHVKIPQVGIVQIDDDVEIGSNCTIDRATFGRTWVQRGARIDNLVMIAHNVVIGEDAMIIAQVGISGSSKIGRRVLLAGQVGVVGHLEIGDDARVGAQSGVSSSVKPGVDVSGSPAIPHMDWLRMVSASRKLPGLREEVRQLRNRVQELKELVEKERK